MNTPKVDSASRCLECSCFNKTASTLAIALSTIVLIGGILALFASTGHNLSALNALSEMGIIGSCLTIGFGIGFTFFSIGWIVAMVRKNSAKTPPPTPSITSGIEESGSTPFHIKTIQLGEPAHDFILERGHLVYAAQSGITLIAPDGKKNSMVNTPTHQLSPPFAFYRGSHKAGTESFIHFGPNPGDKLTLQGATTIAKDFESQVYVGYSNGKIERFKLSNTSGKQELAKTGYSDPFSRNSSILQILPTSFGVYVLAEDGGLAVSDSNHENIRIVGSFANPTCMAKSHHYLYVGTKTNTSRYDINTGTIAKVNDFGITAMATSESETMAYVKQDGSIAIRDRNYTADIQLPVSGQVTKLVFNGMQLHALVGDKIFVYSLKERSEAL